MKKAFSIFFLTITVFFLNFQIFSQEKTARQIADESISKGSPENAINFLIQEISKIENPSSKRSLYAFLASIQESLSKYSDASKTFAKACAIGGGNADGFPKKTNEELVLDAVRCALCAGDWETANSYLNSSVRNSKNPEILAKIKLYEQWSVLCKSETPEDLDEPIAMLDAYKNLDSMKSVKPSILLTLWHLTGNAEYSSALKKEFPSSIETEIVNGKASLLPSPFWYFTPRKNLQIASEKSETNESLPSAETKTESAQISKNDSLSKEKTVPQTEETSDSVKLQLGLFREKTNAQKFCDSVTQKGFKPFIIEEKRSSGIIYYAVLIEQNGDEELSLKLKTAGFENYRYSE